MKSVRVVVPVLAAVTLLTMLTLVSCSKSGGGYSSTPTGPGGGTINKVLDSGNLAFGGQYQHVFSTAGSFPYHCAIHTSMRDTIFVDPNATATSAAISISGFQFTPKHTTVKPGSTVTWTQNDSGTNHTVTSD